MCGQKVFAPPEVYNKKKHDFRYDIYSLGVTMLLLMSNRPFDKLNDITIKNINNMDSSYNLHLRRLVLRMRDDNPTLRPYACHALEQLVKIEGLKIAPQNIILKNDLDKIEEDFINEKNQSQKNIQNNPPNIQFYQNVNYQNMANFQQIQNNFNFPMNIPQNGIRFLNNQNNAFNQNLYNQFINQFMHPQTFIPMHQNNHFIFPNIPDNRMANSGDKIVVASKNTSFIRVLQCLYYILNAKMKEFKFLISNMYKKIDNNSFSVKIIEVLELFNNNSFKNNNFSNNIQKYRKSFALDINRFRGNDEISPIFVFYELFDNLRRELRNKDIPWSNLIFNNYIIPSNVPKVDIQSFAKEYHSPFVDYFYYISLKYTQCSNCNYSYKDEIIGCFIPLPGGKMEKVSNLMKEYFSEKIIDYSCKNCLFNGKGKVNKMFYNSPQYLIIDFEGHKCTKDLDIEFDVSQYILTSIGPRKYQLYAFIFYENGQYKAYIRNNNLWYEYSGENNVNGNRFQSFNSFSPSIAIYRGI